MYFPVSALMTLFGNILQNPLDPRAKSDTRLMNLVVTFLSMLGQEAEQGGVHRMLGVCSEFVRIAKVVIEKAEKEQSSRRKRKNPDSASKSNGTNKAISAQTPAANSSSVETPRPATAATTTPTPTHLPNGQHAATSHLSPSSRSDLNGSYGPAPGTVSSANAPSPSIASAGWPQEYQQNGDFDSFQAITGFGTGVQSPPMAMGGGPFQQPLLPQDLFALPATLDWSWAEMSGGAYPSVENGNFDGQNEMQQ